MKLALTPFFSVIVLALSGCATDLIVDLGHGDSIRLVGQAESFDCDDPEYANVDKVRTTQLRFADGKSMWLCSTREHLLAAKQRQAEFPTPTASSRIIISPSTAPQPAPFQPLLPADPAAPVVHAIGVYQAPRNEITVDVRDNSRPLILALSAYNRAHWRLTVADGVAIEKIILSGYHVQTVSGMAQAVPVEVYTYEPSTCDQCVRGSGFFYGYHGPHERIEELAGQAVNTFQGHYEGGRFLIAAPR
jgi:hypothetical protein